MVLDLCKARSNKVTLQCLMTEVGGLRANGCLIIVCPRFGPERKYTDGCPLLRVSHMCSEHLMVRRQHLPSADKQARAKGTTQVEAPHPRSVSTPVSNVLAKMVTELLPTWQIFCLSLPAVEGGREGTIVRAVCCIEEGEREFVCRWVVSPDAATGCFALLPQGAAAEGRACPVHDHPCHPPHRLQNNKRGGERLSAETQCMLWTR